MGVVNSTFHFQIIIKIEPKVSAVFHYTTLSSPPVPY